MRRGLLVALVVAALLLGALVAAALLSMGPVFGARPDELVVRVTNTGSHEANFTVDADPGLATWRFVLAPGGTQEERLASPPRAQIPVKVHAVWSLPADDGNGSSTKIADGRDCPEGRLLVEFRVDTTIGVSVQATADCV